MTLLASTERPQWPRGKPRVSCSRRACTHRNTFSWHLTRALKRPIVRSEDVCGALGGRTDKHVRPEFRFLFFCVPFFNRSARCPLFSSSMSDGSESEEWRSAKVRKVGVGRKQPRPIDEIASVSSDSSGAPHATTARWYEAFATRVAPSQTTRRSVSSEPAKTQLRSKRTRLPG